MTIYYLRKALNKLSKSSISRLLNHLGLSPQHHGYTLQAANFETIQITPKWVTRFHTATGHPAMALRIMLSRRLLKP